jgi:hypothetical protein
MTKRDLADFSQTDFPAQIREFVPRSHRGALDSDARTKQPAGKFDSLLQSAAGASAEQIDQVIFELTQVREQLHNESRRLSSDIVRYANLNQSLMAAMKIISENLHQWQSGPVTREQALAEFKARWLGGDAEP